MYEWHGSGMVNSKLDESRHVDAFQLAVGWAQCFVEVAFHVPGRKVGPL